MVVAAAGHLIRARGEVHARDALDKQRVKGQARGGDQRTPLKKNEQHGGSASACDDQEGARRALLRLFTDVRTENWGERGGGALDPT